MPAPSIADAETTPSRAVVVSDACYASVPLDAVLHGDCLQIMAGLPDGCIDAVITDPPYCSGSVSEAARTAASGQGLRSENIKKMGWFVSDNIGTARVV